MTRKQAVYCFQKQWSLSGSANKLFFSIFYFFLAGVFCLDIKYNALKFLDFASPRRYPAMDEPQVRPEVDAEFGPIHI
jgi:hypothetical protein